MNAALRVVVAVVAACVIASAAGQVLNLSHDLVPLGIASKNLTPNDPTLDAGPLIFAGTNYAFLHGIPLVTLDKGNYYLLTDQQRNATLIFGRMSNLTLDLADSTIFFRGPFLPNGIGLYQCHNFTLKNFKTDFITAPYTHVQLTSVDTAARTISYATLPGWPDPATFNGFTDPFGENGRWLAVFRDGAIVPGTTRTLVSPPIAGNKLTLTQDSTPWTQAPTLATLRPGDTIVVTARGGGPVIGVWEGDGVTVANVTIQGSAETAIQFYESKNSTADAVRVVPRSGTGLLGSNGDGIHFASGRQNNRIVNSYVARMMDDGLVMDNQHAALVLSQTPPRHLSVKRDQYLRFPNGTPVNFVDPATTLESSIGAVIISQNPPDSDSPQFNETVDLTFDRDLPALPAGFAMVYADPLTRGQGSTITDSMAEDTYGGRGIWIAGLRGRDDRAQRRAPHEQRGHRPVDVHRPVRHRRHRTAVARHRHPQQRRRRRTRPAGRRDRVPGLRSARSRSYRRTTSSSASPPPLATRTSRSPTTRSSTPGRSGIWVGEVNGGTIQRNRIIGHNRHAELPIFGIPSPFVAQVLSDFAVPLVVRYSSGVTIQDNVIRTTGGLRDTNGDAHSDLLWKNTATGATALWQMNDTGILSAATMLSDPNWQVTHTGDLNGDGRTDLVWRSAGGATAVWLKDGLSTTSYAFLPSDPSWAVLRTADLDGDGKSDLVWRNGATGQIAAWLMNGTTAVSGAILFSDPNWVVTHTGDFNGDGRMDLVWRNSATGATAIWLMNGLSPTSSGIVFTSLDWTVTHVGDFNADGKDDLVWRNTTTGQTAIWLMDGLSPTSAGVIFTSPDWIVTHVGDFNDDGKGDLLWRNTTTGQTAIWLMDGLATTSSAVILTSLPWTVTHVGDFNGDRKTDLAWRNTSTGAVAIWLMNGTGIVGSAIELADPNWTLSPADGL